MNLYFDAEFTGLVPETTLMSIGIVSDTEERFYAEFGDYDNKLVTDWIQKNVVNNMIIGGNTELEKDLTSGPNKFVGFYDSDGNFARGDMLVYDPINKRGVDSSIVAVYLKMWLEQFSRYQKMSEEDKLEPVELQFVGDVSHYDFYLLCNLFGGAFDLPPMVNPVCYDICQDICARAEDSDGVYWYADTNYMRAAFDVSRENICKQLSGSIPEGVKHNSLYDAMVVKKIYEGMRENAKATIK